MNACEKLTAQVYQNRGSLRISRDDFRAYLETAVSDSGQPDLLEALEWALEQIGDDLDLDAQAALESARATVRRAKGE